MRRKISIFSPGQSERLARVRLWVLLPSRQASRRRMAGGELRLGTTSMYMAHYIINRPIGKGKYSCLHGCNSNCKLEYNTLFFKLLTSDLAAVFVGASD